jgi:1,4-alpha-glucan branching enzyme
MNPGTRETDSHELSRRHFAGRPIHHVDFFCDAPAAESVRLVGDFNGWDMAATPMRRMPDGRWMASLEIPHGHHEYLFLVDGVPTLDPNASGVAHDENNEAVSLIAVS